jgi:phosphate transport system substrate-binding protein
MRHKTFEFYLLALAAAAFAALLLTPACSRGASGSQIVVAGSTSVQPFADRWAEVFMKKHPGLVVNVQGGGSSAGIQAAKSGAADIGTSSRELKPDEKDLHEIVVARDGLAVIVHPTLPLTDLSLLQVKSIFDGEIRNWRTLIGFDAPIDVVTREEGSGTRGAFQDMVMGKTTRITKLAIVEDSNGTVREIVSGDPNSIGYISLGLVMPRVKALDLNGIKASEASILTGRYRLVRPFLFLTKGQPSGRVKEFIDFVLSPEGQDLIMKEGLIPAGEGPLTR